MKLTKTQKNFRKYMKNQKFEDDPYNYHINRKKTLGGFRPSSSRGLYIIIIFVALVYLTWFIKNGEDVTIPTTYAQPVAAQTNSVTGAIPAREAYYVNIINAALKKVEQSTIEVNKYQTRSGNNIDKIAYKDALQNALSTCSTERTYISKLNAPSQFTLMINSSLAYVRNTELALTNWLDYAERGTRSSQEKGNLYIKMANDSHQLFISDFENYLKQNNYKYTKNQGVKNGITYWYQK